MSNLTAIQINEDLDLLYNNLAASKRQIPAATTLISRSLVFPLFSVLLSFLSIAVFYVSTDGKNMSISGAVDFFTSEGWYFVLATAVVGLVITLFVYNNQILYMSVPESVREKSLILKHLSKVLRKSVLISALLMTVCVFLSAFSGWFVFAIPVLTLVLFFAINMILSAEISRLGAGVALEKISDLIKKI